MTLGFFSTVYFRGVEERRNEEGDKRRKGDG
jgi:hypothetical protein